MTRGPLLHKNYKFTIEKRSMLHHVVGEAYKTILHVADTKKDVVHTSLDIEKYQ